MLDHADHRRDADPDDAIVAPPRRRGLLTPRERHLLHELRESVLDRVDGADGDREGALLALRALTALATLDETGRGAPAAAATAALPGTTTH